MDKEGKGRRKTLVTREEWLKRKWKNATENSANQKGRDRDFVRSVRDKSKVRYFNCLAYGHYALECKKPKREHEQREQKEEANLTQM